MGRSEHYNTHGRDEEHIRFYLINLKGIEHNGYLVTYRRTILEWILQTGYESVNGLHVARDRV